MVREFAAHGLEPERNRIAQGTDSCIRKGKAAGYLRREGIRMDPGRPLSAGRRHHRRTRTEGDSPGRGRETGDRLFDAEPEIRLPPLSRWKIHRVFFLRIGTQSDLRGV